MYTKFRFFFNFYRKLPSMNQMLYTWDNPAGPRILLFEGHKRKEVENDLRKDGIGDFMWVQKFILSSETDDT